MNNEDRRQALTALHAARDLLLQAKGKGSKRRLKAVTDALIEMVRS